MYRYLAPLLLTGVALTLGCTEPEDEPVYTTMLIEHHRQECMGMVEQLCLLVRQSGDQDWSYFYNGIEGLSPQWGRSYEIEVQELPVANPPADGSSIRTVLHRVIKEETVDPGTEFALVLSPGAHRLTEPEPGMYRVYDQAGFSCTDGASCAELNAAIGAGERIEYRFRYASFEPLEFELISWRSCESAVPASPCT